MPVITIGHTYILLISHFNTFKPGQAGYTLSFNGGTAVITDTVKPVMQNAIAKCDGQVVYLKLNKSVKCSSLSGNGSDFYISPKVAKVQSANGADCSSNFDMDSVIINLDKKLQPGNYSLVIKKGSDENTLLDNCDAPIPEFDSIPFTIYPLAPTPMDSITPVACSPDTLQLVFRNAMNCNSIAADGSDFIVTGKYTCFCAESFWRILYKWCIKYY